MAGGGDVKDIDDIYDMENYDSDDSPGRYKYCIAGFLGKAGYCCDTT